jgi:Tol biopolymer transport system component/DNA-binding winged helix-turn-helix (wHTH) protein
MSVRPGDRDRDRDRKGIEPFPRRPTADFQLAGVLVQPSLQRVVAGGVTTTLEPKLMRVLVLLASRPGQVVTKEELFADVWEGAYVTEDVLTRAIGELRRTFGDDSGNPHVIETIRKAGYRLIAPVEPVAGSAVPPVAPGTVAAAPAGAAWPERRVARRLALAVALVAVIVAGVWLLGRRSAAPRPASRDAAGGAMRVRPLTTYPGNERDPAVSPDGSRVAFAWNGGAGDGFSLYVQLVDGDSPLRLTKTAGAHDRAPAWSPDGQRLAFTRSTGESGPDCSILTVSALGGSERRIAPCGDPAYRRLAWSPDGKWLALPVRDAKTSQVAIELLSPDKLERRPLTHPPAGILGDTSPAFSPDGRELAFSRNTTESVGDVWRVALSADGAAGSAAAAAAAEPVRLTFDDRDTMGLEWSGDGSSIVFSSSRAGIYSLWRVPARGGEPTWVAGGGAKMKHPSTARTRNVVAYESWIYQVDLWRVSADLTSGGSRLTSATDEWDYLPSVSPDGERVAFVSTRSGSDEVWVVPSAGGNPARLTSFRGARLELPRWSPDGRRIVFSLRRGARADVAVVDSAGGVPQILTSGEGDAVAPAWSADGRAVYFGSRRPGTGPWRVWRLDLATRKAEVVTPEGGYAAQESPDGSLYFTRADVAGIWKAAPGGATAEVAVPGVPPEDWADWQPARGGLYHRVREAHGAVSLAFKPVNGPDVRLAPLVEQGWNGFSVSPDGKWLLYPKVERHTCDIRLIENPS